MRDQTQAGSSPHRSLLYRDLPAPLPARSPWPARLSIWLPLMVLMMLAVPGFVAAFVVPDGDGLPQAPVQVALVAVGVAVTCELTSLIRRRRRAPSGRSSGRRPGPAG